MRNGAQLVRVQCESCSGQGNRRAALYGTLLDNKRDGVYNCICSQLPLFTSESN